MSHYFDAQANPTLEEPITLQYAFRDRVFTLQSDRGIFSKNHVDSATDLLLRSVVVQAGMSVCDLGSGLGVMGLVLASFYQVEVTCVDVNPKAVMLTQMNLDAHQIKGHVVLSDGLKNLAEKSFDLIVTNPPIRIGKVRLYELFDEALDHLNPGGALVFVMHKKHGVASAIKHLTYKTDLSLLIKAKGFQVWSAKRIDT